DCAESRSHQSRRVRDGSERRARGELHRAHCTSRRHARFDCRALLRGSIPCGGHRRNESLAPQRTPNRRPDASDPRDSGRPDLAALTPGVRERSDGARIPQMIQSCGRTEVGRRRARNEDHILVGEGVLVVCDGMGGHQAGHVASRVAVDTIDRFFSGRRQTDPAVTWPFGFHPTLSQDGNRLRTSIKLANRAVYTAAAAGGLAYAGMGTTVAAAVVAAEPARVTYAHVGDSRVYLLRGDDIEQLTRDDSLANSLWTAAESLASELEL